MEYSNGYCVSMKFRSNEYNLLAFNDTINFIRLTKSIQVFNCSTGSLNPLNWRDFNDFVWNAMIKAPCMGIMWYPSNTSFRTNNLVYKMEIALYHQLSGYVVDVISILRGKKPFLVRDLGC